MKQKHGRSIADLRTIRVIGSIFYGFGVWTALVLSLGGLGCTPQFSWWNAVYWFEVLTMFGFIYWIPIVTIVGTLGYLAVVKTRLAGRPFGTTALAAITIVMTFGIMSIVPHAHGPCTYL